MAQNHALQETGPDYTTSKPALVSPQDRAKVTKKVKEGIRATLKQALDLQCLAYKSAMDLNDPAGSPEEQEQSRARAQAIAATIKAWDIAADRVRVVRGKPMPGSLRPEAKPKKQKQASWAMIDLVPKPKQLPPAE